MTTLQKELDAKQNVVNGKLTQAKGDVREQAGNLKNDDMMRLAGKKDQVVGHLQANYANSWLGRHSVWMLVGTAVALIGAVLAFIFLRSGTDGLVMAE